MNEEMSDPEAQPIVWVSKWAAYSHKYNFGYQLCDDSVGVMFNNTRLIVLRNKVNVHYVETDGTELYYTVDSVLSALKEKKSVENLYVLKLFCSSI